MEYGRDTSPTIDRLAERGVVFERCFASDVPCVPSRTSMFTVRCGYTHGVVCHEGPRSTPFEAHRAVGKGLRTDFARTSLPALLRDHAGLHTVTISSFTERHSAFHFLSGFSEIHDTGGFGHDSAEDVTPKAVAWLEQHAADPDWFLHVNYWDVHTPYRTPPATPGFTSGPSPAPWPDQETIDRHSAESGIRSARDMLSVSWLADGVYPQQPRAVRDTEDLARIIDEYDRAIRHVDQHISQILDVLRDRGVLDNVIIVVTADHGENLGELNAYCGHAFADRATAQVPLIVHWPSRYPGPRRAPGRVYQMDVAATLLAACGVERPDDWEARDLCTPGEAFLARPYLVISQLAQACQRSVLFDWDGRSWLLMQTYSSGYYLFPETMLFDIEADPQQRTDLADDEPSAVTAGKEILDRWLSERHAASPASRDPMPEAVSWRQREETRGFAKYAERLAASGRQDSVDALRARFDHLRDV